MKSAVLLLLVIAASSRALPRKNLHRSIKHDGRIIGGNLATRGQFPWQAGVYYDVSFAGGALISLNWVLTAGHVVDGVTTAIAVHLGDNKLDGDDVITIESTRWFLHPDYDPAILDNDVGLIELAEAVDITGLVDTVALSTTPLGAGVQVTVSGWGATGDWDGEVDELNYVRLQTISNEECQQTLPNQITDHIVCASGNSIQGICTGDSGGPLVDGNKQLVGIAAFTSSEGCETGHPSAFTRVEPYISWIQETISEEK